jgi:hypothetical protein
MHWFPCYKGGAGVNVASKGTTGAQHSMTGMNCLCLGQWRQGGGGGRGGHFTCFAWPNICCIGLPVPTWRALCATLCRVVDCMHARCTQLVSFVSHSSVGLMKDEESETRSLKL